MKTPKIWVGTLSSGEAELGLCIQALQAQTGVEITHHIIEGLPEMEAHDTLWNDWKDVKSNFDLFIKVDADTIIDERDKFESIWRVFENNPRVTGMQLSLFDYFTRSEIMGLGCFSPKAEFSVSANDRLFCDRVHVTHDVFLSSQHLFPGMNPAGKHCLIPHKIQAFHFGLHRFLKNQKDKLRLTYQTWLQEKDSARAWAVIGAMYAHQCKNNFDYTDSKFIETIQNLELDEKLLQELVTFGTSL